MSDATMICPLMVDNVSDTFTTEARSDNLAENNAELETMTLDAIQAQLSAYLEAVYSESEDEQAMWSSLNVILGPPENYEDPRRWSVYVAFSEMQGVVERASEYGNRPVKPGLSPLMVVRRGSLATPSGNDQLNRRIGEQSVPQGT